MRVRGGWKEVQEQLILGESIFRTQRRAHDLQVIGKVSSRVEIRIYLVCEITGMSSLRNSSLTYDLGCAVLVSQIWSREDISYLEWG